MDILALLVQEHSISGAAGSVLSLKFYRDISWAGRLATVFGGWACAAFLTKPFVRWAKLMPPEDYLLGAGFLFGLFSMMIIAAIWKTVGETHWGAAIERRLSGGRSTEAPSFGGGEK